MSRQYAEFLRGYLKEYLLTIPFEVERVVPKGGITILNHFLPEGTTVGANPYVINRHKATFGEDAECWRPDRWLEGGEGHRKKLEASLLTVSPSVPSKYPFSFPLYLTLKITPQVWRWAASLSGEISRYYGDHEASCILGG